MFSTNLVQSLSYLNWFGSFRSEFCRIFQCQYSKPLFSDKKSVILNKKKKGNHTRINDFQRFVFFQSFKKNIFCFIFEMATTFWWHYWIPKIKWNPLMIPNSNFFRFTDVSSVFFNSDENSSWTWMLPSKKIVKWTVVFGCGVNFALRMKLVANQYIGMSGSYSFSWNWRSLWWMLSRLDKYRLGWNGKLLWIIEKKILTKREFVPFYTFYDGKRKKFNELFPSHFFVFRILRF